MSAAPTIRLPGPLTHVSVADSKSAAHRLIGAPTAPPTLDAAAIEKMLAPKQAQLKAAADALNAAVARIGELQAKLAKQTEEQVVELALGIASKVLMQEIQAQRYQIDPIVKEALSRLPGRKGLVVRLNPDDLSHCELAQSTADSVEDSAVRFVADLAVPRAHCTVESSEGFVESKIDAHLEAISVDLKEAS